MDGTLEHTGAVEDPDGTTPGARFPDEVAAQAVDAARELLRAAEEHRSRSERARRARLARLLDDPDAKALTLAVTDTVARVTGRTRQGRLVAQHTEDHPPRDGWAPVDRLLLRGGATVGRVPGTAGNSAAAIVGEGAVRRVRAEADGVVLDSRTPQLARHLDGRRHDGLDTTVNVLGEAVLGEQEALRRRDKVLALVAGGDVAHVAVKPSAVASQLGQLGHDHEVLRVVERLAPIYDAAARTGCTVTLDMEEYRDVHLTVDVLCVVAVDPRWDQVQAGIALQAYLPDTHQILERVLAVGRERTGRGAKPVKVRLVKGANLAMEAVEAELHGWRQAPYTDKAAVDASYKALVERALAPGETVRVGVASHNLFDVAWARLGATAVGEEGRLDIEMLEGMAVAEALELAGEQQRTLMYAPVCAPTELDAAVGYLVRRLDENTAPENFLRAAFTMTPDSPAFTEQARRFLDAVDARHRVARDAHVHPSRRDVCAPRGADGGGGGGAPRGFTNEPEADWSRDDQRQACEEALRRWSFEAVATIPVVVDGDELHHGPDGELELADGYDPSAPELPRYHVRLADEALAAAAVERARAGQPAWEALGAPARAEVLRACAEVMADQRWDTVGILASDAGKVATEADAEVCEAIDFARWYAASAETVDADPGVVAHARGVVVVAPPWNFPYAICSGGVLAALAAGNAVVLKPSPQTTWTQWMLARQLWQGGVPHDVLQFVPCADDPVGTALVCNPDVDGVVLTGSVDTARLFQAWRPTLALWAETSGKNALVITAAADIEAAVRDLVRSAFGHAGQKCSAASLAIVEGAVYDSEAFRRKLRDAVESLSVGASWDPLTTVGPLVESPGPKLQRALCELDDGEEWLVEPRQVGAQTWTPGVRLGVRPGSWFHRTECFGPVLGVMRADSLDQAIEWQNATEYGLTGGIHTLDRREVDRWLDRVQVGNAYVNRGTTGAVVGRQPFGGWKASSVGAGVKAGGAGYTAALSHLSDPDGAHASYAGYLGGARWYQGVHAAADGTAELNVVRHRPVHGVVLRVDPGTAGDGPGWGEQLWRAVWCARAAGVPLEVSCGHGWGTSVTAVLRDAGWPHQLREESMAELAARLPGTGAEQLRLVGAGDEALWRAANDSGIRVCDDPVLAEPRWELRNWYREQSVAVTNHRYGNVGTAPRPSW